MVEVLSHQKRPINPDAVRALYDSAEWWPQRTAERIAFMLQEGIPFGAWDEDRLVGFARAISDGCFHAYIDDVVMHPDWRRRGVALGLLAQLLNELSEIDTISLFCEPELVALYEAAGFKARPRQVMLHLQRERSG